MDAATGVITTVAGTGNQGYSSDGGPATSAVLSYPQGVFVAGTGHLYIADMGNNRVCKVDATTGIITTVAGGANWGYLGDGGVATSASLQNPKGLCVDDAGHLYIADTNNHRVRKVDGATGIITTVAGDGVGGFSGDGGAATSASLNQPSGVFVDGAGHLYIADTNNHRVRKVDKLTGIITTVVGNGSSGSSGDGGLATQASLRNPYGVFVDGAGHLYIADYNNPRIRKVDGSTGIITTVAGSGNSGFSGDGGPAIEASLRLPLAVFVDATGNIYISDSQNHRVRKVGTYSTDAYSIDETTAASGLSGTTAVEQGGEVQLFSSGLTGDGQSGVSAVTLTLSDLSSPTGLAQSDFSELRLYVSTDATLDGNDTRIGSISQGSIHIGSPTTVPATVLSVPPGGTERFYLVSAEIIPSATVGHAFTVDFAAGGVTTSAGDKGASVAADDANKVVIATGPNLPPVVSNTLFTQRLTVGGTAFSQALEAFPAVFNDPNGDALSYTTSSSDLGVAAASISGNLLTVVPVGEGGATITIQAEDGDGEVVQTTFAVLVSIFHAPTSVGPGQIATMAGGFIRDGVAATSTSLSFPAGIHIDGAGNLYFADSENQRIRKVDTSGIIITVAGNGVRDFSGDGEAAVSASLAYPFDVCVDGAGNLYIADRDNHRVRRVDTSGIITTVAGDGNAGFSGDGGSASSASLNSPRGVFMDGGGNLYIADLNNHRVRKVDTSGIITTVAGDGNAGFSGDGGMASSASLNSPFGVFVDEGGSLYIADLNNNRVRKVDSSGTITTVAGNGNYSASGDGGPATSAGLRTPTGVFVDGVGNLYIADRNNHRVRKVDSSGVITTMANGIGVGFSGDGGPATSARMEQPSSVFVDGVGNLYIADRFNHRVRKVDTSGIITTVAGGNISDGGAATSASFNRPEGLFVDGGGNVFIADTGNHRIRKVDTSGNITTVAGDGSAFYSGDGGPAISTGLRFPRDVFVDGEGNLYIPDAHNMRIRKVDTSGNITTVAGDGTPGFSGDGSAATSASLRYPSGVFLDGVGNLYIADTNNHRVRKVDTSGSISTVAGNGNAGFSGDGGAATSASLNQPYGVSGDGSGNLYIADRDNHRVRKVDMLGNITTVAGDGTPGFSGDGGVATSASVWAPARVFVDGTGNLYVTDTYSNRIRKVDTSGIITTVAGDGIIGFSGDGGPATSARLLQPYGVFVDGLGDLYISDTGNHRVRKVGAPSIDETRVAAGLSEIAKVEPGEEVQVFSIGFTGDGINSVTAFYLTLSDLSTATGLVQGDFTA